MHVRASKSLESGLRLSSVVPCVTVEHEIRSCRYAGNINLQVDVSCVPGIFMWTIFVLSGIFAIQSQVLADLEHPSSKPVKMRGISSVI